MRGCVCVGLRSVICLFSFLGGYQGVGRVFLFASLCCFLFVGKSYSCNLGFLNWVIALSGLFWPFGYFPP